MRVIFIGTPDFATLPLQAIREAGHTIPLVVSRPDARRGRGRKAAEPPVKAYAREVGIDVFQPENINAPESVQRLREAEADLGVVVAYGALLSGEVLTTTTARGYLNVHASLLPKYRGAAPVNWAIMRGERETGVTIQRMTVALDAGPILAQKRLSIGEEETAGELHVRLCAEGASLLVSVLERMAAGERIPEHSQGGEPRSYAPKLSKRDGRLDWSLSAREICDRVRGLTPWPGACAHFAGASRSEDVTLLKLMPAPAATGEGAAAAGEHVPAGTVLGVDRQEGIAVQTGAGAVIIRELKPACGKAMSGADFAHGRHVEQGDQFA